MSTKALSRFNQPFGSLLGRIPPTDRFDFVVSPAMDVFEEILDGMVGNRQLFSNMFETKVKYPKTDIFQDVDSLVFQMAVPGINKEDLNVEFSENILSISSKDEKIKEKEEKRFIIRELKQSSFTRKWNLEHFNVEISNEQKINCDLKDGILSIKVPLRKEGQEEPKKIKLEIN
jgi:HSP20 family protein